MSGGDLLATLHQGLTDLGEDPATHPCQTYLDYLALLGRWNLAYNLTGIRDLKQMLTHHIFDSLAVLPFIRGAACLDVGSGAGLPGLILALARPAQNWCLLDSNNKKIRFLRQAVLELHIDNVTLVHARVEDYHPATNYSTIISRALSALPAFYRQVISLLQEHGRIIAMKGVKPEPELQELQAAGINYTVHALQVPGLNKQRHLVVMDKT